MKTSQAKGFLARSMAFALAALPAALLLRGAAFAADETQRVAVALMATARTPTYNVFNDNLNPVFRNAAANGTLAIVSNAQQDTRLNTGTWPPGAQWMNYGTNPGANGGPGLFGFDFSKLPRFAGATIHLAQFMI
jgi:hypothetical protein